MSRIPRMWIPQFLVLFLASAVSLSFIACGGGDDDNRGGGGANAGAAQASQAITMPKTYKGPGIDSSVSAEMGGLGFEQVAEAGGWQTHTVEKDTYFKYYASPDAKKGGTVTSAQQDFPAVIRPYGKDANTTVIQLIENLCFEQMIDLDPVTLDFMPELATHWKVDPDGQTYYYRLNPNARFHDGYPVTSADVVATHKLLRDQGILDPFINQLFGEQFDMAEAVSPYIVKVRSKEKNWKNMRYFGGMSILPAHVLDTMDGSKFLDAFKYKLPPGSGPYVVQESEIVPQKTLVLTRLADWWRKDDPLTQGTHNFDKIRFVTIIDEASQVQEFLAGNLDFYHVTRAQWWMEKFNDEIFERGVALKKKIYNDNPQGFSGFAFNTRKAPFDDVRVRQAFIHLFPREKLIEKIMYGQYTISDSYFPNSPYANPNNPKYRYDPQAATKLLAEAGYTKRNAQGILVHEKTGKPFVVELPITEGADHIMAPVQQEMQKAGIKIEMRKVDFAQMIKLADERKFDLLYFALAGLVFPNPYSMLHSSMADQQATGNRSGFKNPVADSLIEIELLTFDPNERIKQLQMLDSIFMAEKHYAISWYAPFTRLVYWAYLKQPEFFLSKVGDDRDVFQYWWMDESMKAEVVKGRRDKSVKLEPGEVDVKFWPEYNKSNAGGAATAGA